jgi:hypothetical protein
MKPCLGSCFVADPAFMLPKGRYMVMVPAHLLAKRSW